MANFEHEYKTTPLISKSGYNATGGDESWRSISRNEHPSWVEGWQLIDRKRKEPNFPANLKSDEHLEFLVRKFWKEHYWDRYRLDDWPSQTLAGEIFRSGIRLGRRNTIRFLQRSLNVLNKQETLWEDVKVDGVYGDKTHQGVLTYFVNLPETRWNTLYFCLIALEGEKYITTAELDPEKQDYIYIWIDHIFKSLHNNCHVLTHGEH